MTRPHVVSPAELSSLRDLELRTRTIVEGLRQGLHQSPFHGYSAEFSQYRHYRPGDDLKYVDWKAFGRTDRFYTRQFRETTNLAALFVLDASRSMAFRGKFELARTVCGVLGALVLDQGDTAGLLAEGAALAYVPPRSGRHHLRTFLAALAAVRPEGQTGPAGVLVRAARLMRRRGLVVVVSDFYDEDADLAEVRRLARMGHDVIVVHVMAREEVDLRDLPAGEIVDAETGQRMVVEPRVAASDYGRRVAAFLGRIADAAAGDGLDYLRLVTGTPVDAALRRFLVQRSTGRRVVDTAAWPS